MKYLKLFENNNDKFWLVRYAENPIPSTNDRSEIDIWLFDSKEKAEDLVVDLVNEERESLTIHGEGKEYTEEMIFTECEDAMNWYEKNLSDIYVSIEEIKVAKGIELPEEVKKLREIRRAKNKFGL